MPLVSVSLPRKRPKQWKSHGELACGALPYFRRMKPMTGELEKIIQYLKDYDGKELRFMEVCGTHTAAIFKGGIRSLISPKIKLISGPGCPVCVTPAAYVDKCVEYALSKDTILYSFGDMLKVPGTGTPLGMQVEEGGRLAAGSLSEAKGLGAKVQIIYSPFDVLTKAEKEPDRLHVIAAVGFETTAPIYALLAEQLREKNIQNVRLVTALKTIIPALTWICQSQEQEDTIDGFICPGHVSVIIGTTPYEPLAQKYKKPFVVAGFEPEHLLVAIYDLVRQREEGIYAVRNYYKNAVKTEGNEKAKAVLEQNFTAGSAVWRGLGPIDASGLYLKGEEAEYDGGSRGLDKDLLLPPGCACADVITGRIDPKDCPVFGKGCTPTSPYGPCMVSAEGACGIWYKNR